MENSVPLAAVSIDALHDAAYFHDVLSVRGEFNAYGREVDLESGDKMGWADNNIMLVGGLESLMEVVSDVRNADVDVVNVNNDNNQKE